MNNIRENLKDTYSERKALRKEIENYDESKTDESLSDLKFKDVFYGGKVEAIKEVESHNNRIDEDGNRVNTDNPFDYQAASQKMFGAKKELLGEFERQHKNGGDSDTMNELRSAIEAISGKIEALEEIQEAEAADQRTKAYKENRSFDTAPNIQTKTKSLNKSVNIMSKDKEIYNSSEPTHKKEGKVSAAEYFGAIATKPKTPQQRNAVQNSLTSGGYEPGEDVWREVIDKERTTNALDIAGARTAMVSGAGSYKVVTIEDNMVAEHSGELEERSLDASNPFGSKTIDLSTLRAHFGASREILDDARNAGEAITTSLSGTISDRIVEAAFVSQGANAPVGLSDIVTQEETFANGSQASIMNVVNASKQLYDNNVPGEKQSVILSPTAWQAMQLESDDNSRYQHMPPAVDNMQKIVSSGVPAGEAYVGDFSNVLLAYGSSLILENYTSSLARKFAVEFLAAIRWDIAVLRPKSLVRIAEAEA